MKTSFRTRGIAVAAALAALGSFAPGQHAVAASRAVCTNSELQSAVNSAQPGDVIEMCASTWQDTAVAIQSQGTQAQPIVIRAAEPGRTKLTGNVRIELGGQFIVLDGLVFSGTYTGNDKQVIDFAVGNKECFSCRVTNTVFDSFNPTNLEAEVQWINVRGANHRIDHNSFVNKLDEGRMVTLVRKNNNRNDLHVDHNLFAHRPEDSGPALGIGVSGKFAQSVAGALVERNLFWDVNGSGEIIVNKSSGNRYIGNVIKESRGALSLRQGNDILVARNYFLGGNVSRSGGVRVMGANQVIVNNLFAGLNPNKDYVASPIVLHSGDSSINPQLGWPDHTAARNVTIAWNTIVDSGYPIAIGVGDGNVHPSGIRIANNIVDRPVGNVFRLDCPLPGDTWVAGNMFNGGQLGLSSVLGFLSANPQLQRDSSGVYRLGAASSAIQASVPVSNVEVQDDIDDDPRGAKSDIGADEYGSSRLAPVGICDVGPETYKYALTANCTNVAKPEPPANIIVT